MKIHSCCSISFLSKANIPLYIYATLCVPIHLLMDTWIASTFWLWTMLLRICVFGGRVSTVGKIKEGKDIFSSHRAGFITPICSAFNFQNCTFETPHSVVSKYCIILPFSEYILIIWNQNSYLLILTAPRLWKDGCWFCCMFYKRSFYIMISLYSPTLHKSFLRLIFGTLFLIAIFHSHIGINSFLLNE